MQVLADDDVLRLQVAVHDARLVRLGKPACDLERDVKRGRDRERAVGEHLAQRLPLDELHRDEDAPLVLADLVHRRDVWVRDRGRGARLAEHPLSPIVVRLERRRQYFERDRAAQRLVLSPVDDAHPPLAEPPENPKVSDARRVRRRQRRARAPWRQRGAARRHCRSIPPPRCHLRPNPRARRG